MNKTGIDLLGIEPSVYTRIVRLALEGKGLGYQLVDADVFEMEQGEAANRFRALNPFMKIPVFRHGDFVLYETQAITRYIDEAYDGPALQPADPASRARMNQIIGILDNYAYRPMIWDVYVQLEVVPQEGGITDHEMVKRGLVESARCLDALEQLADFGPFLCGEHLTLADCHAYPMLSLFGETPKGRTLMNRYRRTSNFCNQFAAGTM